MMTHRPTEHKFQEHHPTPWLVAQALYLRRALEAAGPNAPILAHAESGLAILRAELARREREPVS